MCWYVDFSCLLIFLNEIINLAERKRAYMRGNNQIVVDKTYHFSRLLATKKESSNGNLDAD